MIDPSPELKARKERYQQLGLLIESDSKPVVKVIKLPFNKTVIIQLGWSKSGAWDDYTSCGSVHTTFFGIRRVSDLSQSRNEVDSGYQILLGPLVFGIAIA